MPNEPILPAIPIPVDAWINYQVPTLTQILADDLDPAFDRALAWGRVGSLMSVAMGSLVAAIDLLNEVWIMESSSAALRFSEEVGTLQAQMHQISDTANSNKEIVNRAAESFDKSRSEIILLAREWEFNVTQESGSMRIGSTVSGALLESWRTDLNNKAHMALEASDRAAFEESQALHVPDDFRTGSLDPFNGKLSSGVEPIPGVSNPASKILRSDQPKDLIANRDPSGNYLHPESDSSAPDGLGAKGRLGSSLSVTTAVPALAPHLQNRTTTSYTEGRAPQAGSTIPSALPDGISAPGLVDHGLPGGIPMIGGVGSASSGRNGSRRRGNSQAERWQTKSGAPGVLLPAYVEPIHDAGPGVLGVDR